MAEIKQSKTFNGSSPSDEWAWKQEVIEQFNDDYITTNKSIITVNTYLTRTKSNSSFGGTADCIIKCKNSSGIEIFNKTVRKTFNYPTYAYVNNWIWIQSETFEVLHNADGTQSITVESSLNTTDFTPNWTYAYGEMVLATIPRTSKVTCPSFNIGDSTVINIERASDSFTHKLTYQFGNSSGVIVDRTSSISVGWTPNANDFHNQIPNSISGIGTITCQTYSGNILVGTSTCNFTAYVTQANPTVSASIEDTNSSTINLTGNSSKLIKYFSKPRVVIGAVANKGASIVAFKTVLADGQSSESQTTVFPKIDAQTITVSAKDSRGWSNIVAYNPEFVNYLKLAFTNIDVNRTESTSNTIYANVYGNYFNQTFGAINNNLSMKWRYKLSASSDWNNYTDITANILNNSFSFDAELGSNFDNNNDYDFEFIISDKLMTVSTGVITVSKGTGIIDIYSDSVQINGDILLESGNIILDYEVVDSW